MQNDWDMQKSQIVTLNYYLLAPISTYPVAQGLAQLIRKQGVGLNPLRHE